MFAMHTIQHHLTALLNSEQPFRGFIFLYQLLLEVQLLLYVSWAEGQFVIFIFYF